MALFWSFWIPFNFMFWWAMAAGVSEQSRIHFMIGSFFAVVTGGILFIKYFYEEDPDGYAAGKRFHESLPSYDEMLWKFWVWPLSKFYPAYRNRNKWHIH